MTASYDPRPTEYRRTFLGLVGATAGASLLGGALEVRADAHGSVVLEQGDRCVELQPLTGDEPVEDLYDYAYPMDEYEGPPGSDGNTFSSEGTTDLQRDRTSVLFLYDGPDGLSLVVVHGHLDGEADAGGTVSFTLDGVPESATWIVRDDYYLEDGEQADTNFDRWDVGGDVHAVDWAYASGRTDGGALGGLGEEFEVTVEPAFNEDAVLAGDLDVGPIEDWEALSGDRESPDRIALQLDEPVTVRSGTCGDGEGEPDEEADEEQDQEPDEEPDEEPTDDADTDDGETGERSDDPEGTERRDESERQLERQEEKHERKMERQQEKHDRKMERQQEKPEWKQEKQQEKHERKQEKQQEKHERKQAKQQEKHDRKMEKYREKRDRKGGERSGRDD